MVTVHASPTISYEIPEGWWKFCDLDKWKPTTEFYLTKELNDNDVTVIPLAEIQPITRDLGNGSPIRKYKLVPILLRALRCVDPAISPVPLGLSIAPVFAL